MEVLRFGRGYQRMYFPVPYFQFEPFESPDAIKAFFIQSTAKYVFAPSNPGPEGLRNYTALVQAIDFLKSDLNNLFEPIKEFTLPNGDIVTIYRRFGIAPQEVRVGGCVSSAGAIDGVEAIKLTPNTTYIFFTGHFSVQDKYTAFDEPGVLQIRQIENTVRESVLEIHNLPKSGSTLCAREGLGLDLTTEVKIPLIEKGRCGGSIDCSQVQLTKWFVGDLDVVVTKYFRGDFTE